MTSDNKLFKAMPAILAIIYFLAAFMLTMREINTYLATRVFDQFSQFREHTPTVQDVVRIAENARVIDLQKLLI